MKEASSTKFWKEKWCDHGIMKDKFPRLFALECNKDISVREKLLADRFDNSFRRGVRGGIEEAQYSDILNITNSMSLSPQADRFIWSLTNEGMYTVASMRVKIDDLRTSCIAPKTRWLKCVPIKVNILAWKVKLDALPSRLNLSKRGLEIESLRCPICDCGVESMSHLFLGCKLVIDIYSKIARWWDLPYSGWSTFEEWWQWLQSTRLPTKTKELLEGVIYTVWWAIWGYRNKLFFDKNRHSKEILFDNIRSWSFSWCKYRCKASFSWIDWLKNPNLISM